MDNFRIYKDMKIAFFSAKSYDIFFFKEALKKFPHEIIFLPEKLCPETAHMAKGFDAVCAFVNDDLQEKALKQLHDLNISIIAMRCTGFNNLDLKIASELRFQVVNVPSYSPYAVAEHTMALILSLNRKIPKAYNRSREGNFSLESLIGFDMYQKTVGMIGTGAIGLVMTKILSGFGCRILGYDPKKNVEVEQYGLKYCSLETLFKESDIITLHCPLIPETYHVINSEAIAKMKDHVMIINTGRGALIDTKAVIDGLKNGKVGYLGIDVYEEEANLFFEDFSEKIILDDMLARLLTMPNVIVTSHMGFFTENALSTIANTTLQNLTDLQSGKTCKNTVISCEC